MKEFKIIQLLKAISKEETKMFRKFAASPYFNEGRNLLPLIDELLKYYPEFRNEEFSKEKIFDAVYGGNRYDQSAADKQLSRASGLAEKFILQRAFEKNSFEKNIIYAREYNDRKLDSFFTKQLVKTEDELAGSSPFESDFFYNKYALESVRSGYIISNKDLNKYRDYVIQRSNFVLLDIIIKYIYSTQDIRLAEYNLNLDLHDSLAATAAKHIDLAGLVKLVNDSDNPYSYVLEYKYYELMAMINLSAGSFMIYKDVVYKHMGKLNWSEKYNALGAMLSVCIMGSQSGQEHFEEKSVNICKKMLDENSYSYYENNFANMTRYYNILATFFKNNQSVFIDELIDKFGHRLDPDNKESMINYSYMCKYFSEKNFRQALTYHAKIDYNHSLLKLNVRILLLKIYYELGYLEEAESLADTSLKYYSALSGVSVKVLLRATNLTKYVKKLIRMDKTGAEEKWKTLIEDVEQNEDINSKPWLIEKIEESHKKNTNLHKRQP